MSDSGQQLEQIKNSMRATWMAGDFGMIAKTNAAAAEAFVDRLGIPPGMDVLDVATGTGNLAIPLARRGAIVTGVDIATNLLAQARERAAAEELAVTFDEGDAEQLPYGDSSFDVAVTMFGAMFAPRPELVTLEFSRVLRSGGRLAMGNWSPTGFIGQMFKLGSRYAPPPPGIVPPVLWGDEATVQERLSPYFREIETRVIPFEFDLPSGPAGTVAFFRRYFGPTQVTFNRLDPAGQESFAADLESLWVGANVATDPENQTLVHGEYLQVTAIRL